MTTTTVSEAIEASEETQADADFEAGALMEMERPLTAPTEVKPDEKGGAVEAQTRPEYVQLTKEQFDRLDAAAKRTDDFEKQMSKAFGTIGDMQKIVRTMQGQTPRGVAVKIPDDAFAAMQRDFPEVATHMRSALEATLKGMTGTGGPGAEINTADLERKVEERVLRLETEALEDAHPDWAKIVGAVDVRRGDKPDQNNAFRKWLATKDATYQARVNGTNSASVIARAINTFKAETKTTAKAPDARGQARADRIQDAVRPKSDGGPPPSRNTDEDFEAGFRTG